MKFSSITLIVFIFYAFLGICPMQISAMSMDMSMDMSMSGDCWDCITALDSFALKEVQIKASDNSFVFVFPALPTHTRVVASFFEPTPLPLARIGHPPLELSIIETTVLRT